ncbi:MAG: arylesterase [Methylophilaceae bacterium]
MSTLFMNAEMKNLFYLFLLILFFSACRAEKLAAIPSGSTVVVLGDSLSYGTGAAENEDYPTLLAASTGWNIVNAGVPGDTTEDGLARLADLLAEHQPTLLVIELGGNDFLRGVSVSQTIANLKTIITEAKSKNITVLLVAIPAFSPLKAAIGGLSDHPLYEEMAEEMQVLLIEDIFSDVLSKNSLKADHIHPNAKGYRVVEENMRASLTELGLL